MAILENSAFMNSFPDTITQELHRNFWFGKYALY